MPISPLVAAGLVPPARRHRGRRQQPAAHDGNRLQRRTAEAGWMIAGRPGTRGQKVRLGLGGTTWVGGGARGTPGSACLNQRGAVSGAAPVLLVGVPRDLEKMTIGIGEVPGVDAERAHMSGRGRRASGGFDVPEQLVDLCL